MPFPRLQNALPGEQSLLLWGESMAFSLTSRLRRKEARRWNTSPFPVWGPTIPKRSQKVGSCLEMKKGGGKVGWAIPTSPPAGGRGQSPPGSVYPTDQHGLTRCWSLILDRSGRCDAVLDIPLTKRTGPFCQEKKKKFAAAARMGIEAARNQGQTAGRSDSSLLPFCSSSCRGGIVG